MKAIVQFVHVLLGNISTRLVWDAKHVMGTALNVMVRLPKNVLDVLLVMLLIWSLIHVFLAPQGAFFVNQLFQIVVSLALTGNTYFGITLAEIVALIQTLSK